MSASPSNVTPALGPSSTSPSAATVSQKSARDQRDSGSQTVVTVAKRRGFNCSRTLPQRFPKRPLTYGPRLLGQSGRHYVASCVGKTSKNCRKFLLPDNPRTRACPSPCSTNRQPSRLIASQNESKSPADRQRCCHMSAQFNHLSILWPDRQIIVEHPVTQWASATCRMDP